MPKAGSTIIKGEHKEEIKLEICRKIADGVNLREICRGDGMPAWRTVYDWMEEDAAFSAAIARAREVGADAIAIEALEIMDAEPERDEKGKLDPAHVAWQKNRAELRLKLLAKWSPKLYGDKVTQDVTSSDGSFSLPTRIEIVAPRMSKDDDAED